MRTEAGRAPKTFRGDSRFGRTLRRRPFPFATRVCVKRSAAFRPLHRSNVSSSPKKAQRSLRLRWKRRERRAPAPDRPDPRSADFPVCRFAGFPTRWPWASSNALLDPGSSRLESRRYGRLENLRYAPSGPGFIAGETNAIVAPQAGSLAAEEMF